MRWIHVAIIAAACSKSSAPPDAPGSIGMPAPYCTPRAGTALQLHEIASGLVYPVLVTSPPGDPRLFVVERSGHIRIIDGGVLSTSSFVDIEEDVAAVQEEQGLLGLAFHPRYAQNGRFFIAYTRVSDGAFVVGERHATPTATVADAGEKVLIEQPNAYGQHNGGMLRFGPDGLLYISVGDAGSGGLVVVNAQDPTSFAGKILRLDIDGGAPYAIPFGNVWAEGGGRPEVYAWGMRNPWRFDIDVATGDLMIGDVGHSSHEEIDVLPAGSVGKNFGWPVFEGTECFAGNPAGTADCAHPEKFVSPLVTYDHTGDKCAVMGGVVYRGSCLSSYVGAYFYGDYCTGEVDTLTYANGVASRPTDITDALDPQRLLHSELSSFGTDTYGELYVTSVHAGVVYRVELQ